MRKCVQLSIALILHRLSIFNGTGSVGTMPLAFYLKPWTLCVALFTTEQLSPLQALMIQCCKLTAKQQPWLYWLPGIWWLEGAAAAAAPFQPPCGGGGEWWQNETLVFTRRNVIFHLEQTHLLVHFFRRADRLAAPFQAREGCLS